eukprot:CFRG3309T1
MSFSFNFNDDASETTQKLPAQQAVIPEHTYAYMLKLSAPIRKNEIPCEPVSVGDITIFKKVLENATYELANTGSADIKTALSTKSDLIPGVYEGGLKTWECSIDLLVLLVEMCKDVDMSRARVLELGCGSALPGIYLLTYGNAARVDFQDYNVEVLTHVTVPNVVLNSGNGMTSGMEEVVTPEKLSERSSFYAGDWSSFVQVSNPEGTQEKKYDIILTSETIYEPTMNNTLLSTIKDSLVYPSGVAFVAAKSYYFGVGGSVRSFQALVELDTDMAVQSVYESTDGVSREILRISFATK